MQAITELMKNDYVIEIVNKVTSYLQQQRYVLMGGGVPLVLVLLWYRRPAKFPPGPRGVPGLGVVPFLDRMAARSFATWGRKYPDGVMSVRMGGNDLIILNKPDVIRKAFGTQQFMGRPAIQLLFQLSKGNGIFFVDDTPMLWEQRKFMGTVLRKLGMGKEIMSEKVYEESGLLCQEIENFHQKPFDILWLLTNAVSNNACLMSLGTRFEYNNETFQNLLKKFCHAFYDKKASAAILACLCYGPLAHLPGFSNHVSDILRDTKYCLDIIQSIIDSKRESCDYDNPKDFCEHFFVEQRASKPNYTDQQLLMSVKDILFGGTITTTSTIRWALYCAIKHPELQEQVYQEIAENIGEGEITYSTRNKTPFTWAFLYEVMRRYTTVPLGVPHSAPHDLNLGGHVIPAGTPVFSNVYACHMDPHVWSQPEMFRPGRHLNSSGQFQQSSNFLAFSVGSRRCTGEALALEEIYIFFAAIVRRFQVSADPSSFPDAEDASFGLLNIPAPFRMVAKQR